MESKITIIRDNNGKVLGTKRPNPTTKPVIKKPLTNTEMVSNNEAKSPVTTTPTLAEVKAKIARGESLTNEEAQVLIDNIKKTEAEYAALRKQTCMNAPMKDFIPEGPKFAKPQPFSELPKTSVTAKTEFPPKTYPTASDLYLRQQEKIRQLENSARPRSTLYRPLDNKVKGGFERALEKMHQLGETKAELTEKSAKMAKKFEKMLEFCKKYGKSVKA